MFITLWSVLSTAMQRPMETQLLQVSALNFRSQVTCPVSLEAVKPQCPQGLLLGLNKFQLFKRCPLHLQLFSCVEKASPTPLIRLTLNPHGVGGHLISAFHGTPHLNTSFHEPQRGSLPLRSWPCHVTRLQWITRFGSDTREHVTGQNNDIDSLVVPKDLDHKTYTE